MSRITYEEALERARRIRLIAMDVDGALTDGRIIYSSDGRETKCFHVRDGYGIALAIHRGLKIAWISGRQSQITTDRAAELGVTHVVQGRFDKLEVLASLAAELGVALDEVAFIGDDVIDNAAIAACGLGVAVADAHPDTLAAARWVTTHPGGKGAVRELVDLVLKARA